MTQFVGDLIRNLARPEQRVLFYTDILYLFILTLPTANHYLQFAKRHEGHAAHSRMQVSKGICFLFYQQNARSVPEAGMPPSLGTRSPASEGKMSVDESPWQWEGGWK